MAEMIQIYKKVLEGESWPKEILNSINIKLRVKELLEYLFEKNNIDSPEKAREFLTPEYIKENHLATLFNNVYKPVELLPEENDHLVWIVFPETQLTEHELILKTADDVFYGRRKQFPNKYFVGNANVEKRAVAIFIHLCEDLLKYSEEEITEVFGMSYGIKTLQKYRMKSLATVAYPSLKKLFSAAYPYLQSSKE